MIQLKNISVGYGGKALLHSVSTQFTAGTLTALIGRNGSGKSTLLRALAGLSTPLAGAVEVDGEDISRIAPSQMARRVAFVTTERVRIANLTCRDVVSLGRAPYTNWIGRMQDVDEEVVMRSLSHVGMQDYAMRTMDKMSDGECQRIMIARALAQDTSTILLDEPTSFLDMPNRYELCTMLARLAHEQNKCIIFSTHELDIALSLCDDIALVDGDSLVHKSAKEMAHSGLIERLFCNANVSVEALMRFLPGD